MGNQTNYNKDRNLLNAYNEFNSDFAKEVPLFNIEDISFPLSTKDIKIVDAKGKRVKLAGGNWSGAHMCRHCVDGLQCRPMREIAMDIRYKFKMNCIRLTYSLQMFFEDRKIPQKYLQANPQLKGKTGMEIFDITIQTLTDVGLMVILNNHTSTSQWCCSNQDGDGLWWSRQFPECTFFDCAEAFAKRYKNNPRVIGMDLRNQLRKANGLAPTWGDGNPLTDWKRAAQICADKVQAIAPDWLILVSGLDYQLDLTGVHKSRLELKLKNKLVYTGHFYGFSWPQPQITSWHVVSYESFSEKLFNTQTSVRALGYPYFLGEFGNNTRDIPWNYLIRYLKETDIDWTYWALDGFKCQRSQDQTYGVFTNDFSEARHPDLLADMIAVGPPPGTVIQRPVVNKQAKIDGEMANRLRAQQYVQNFAMEPRLNSQRDPNLVKLSTANNFNQNNLNKMPLLGGNPGSNIVPMRFTQIPQNQLTRYQNPAQNLPQKVVQQRTSQPFPFHQIQAQQVLTPQQPQRNQPILMNQHPQQQNNQMGPIARQNFIKSRQQQANLILRNNSSQGKFQAYYQQQPNYQPTYQGNNLPNQFQGGHQVNQNNALNMNPSTINFSNNYPGNFQNRR